MLVSHFILPVNLLMRFRFFPSCPYCGRQCGVLAFGVQLNPLSFFSVSFLIHLPSFFLFSNHLTILFLYSLSLIYSIFSYTCLFSLILISSSSLTVLLPSYLSSIFLSFGRREGEIGEGKRSLIKISKKKLSRPDALPDVKRRHWDSNRLPLALCYQGF